MKKLELTQKMYDMMDEFGLENYYACCRIEDGKRMLTGVGDSYEYAAELLWRSLCDAGLPEITDNVVVFVSNGEAFESESVYGCAHYVFDHGRVSFDDVLWNEIKHDTIDSWPKDKPFENENGWTLEAAVDEMIALWQTGSCEKMPWDICGDWQFINEELGAVLGSPKFN